MTRLQRRIKQALLRHGGRATCGTIADELDIQPTSVAAAARRMEPTGEFWVRDEKVDDKKAVVVYNYNPDKGKTHDQHDDKAGTGPVPGQPESQRV